MDLNDLEIKKDTLVVELRHPITDEPLTMKDGRPMSIEVYGPFSTKYKEVNYAISNARLKKASKTGKVELTAEEIEEQQINRLIKTTTNWTLQVDGKELPFSEDKAREVYERFPFARYQVVAEQEDVTNFFG